VTWRHVADAVGLLTGDGGVRPTIFAEMSALAARTGAVNLGQGAPDAGGPAHVVEAAREALAAGRNQYAPGDGVPELRRAIADHQARHYGLAWDADTEVLVTTGATEGIAAAVLALVGPGDEVVALEPAYDSYAAVVAMAGGTWRPVPMVLRPGGGADAAPSFALDVAALREVVTERTRVILLNTPHNPTGAVLGSDDLAEVARVAQAAGAVVVTDEVYEHLTFDGATHVPIATLPGMAERTLTVSSAGKTLSFTGWKVGWVTGPAELVTAVRTVKQFLTFTSGAPLQPAVAAALADPDGRTAAWLADLRASLQRRRDLLSAGLRATGFDVAMPSGGYFVVADGARLGFADGAGLCRELPERVGVVAVPVSAFCRDGSPAAEQLRSWVRFTFVKDEAVLVEGLRRLGRLTA
jgi:N-succinyldiaminopimelate aminotransferase